MPLNITIVIPVYDDWLSLERLASEIHAVLGRAPFDYQMVVVDDASPTEMPASRAERELPANFRGTTLLRLRKNLGHQRAIAVGLVEVHSKQNTDLTVIMDGDGEDSPGDIERLVHASTASGCTSVVFASRSKRMEGRLFRWSYELYRLVHWLAVGPVPRVGNFSVVPAKFVSSLVVDPNLWNHYAAAVFASRLPHETVPTPRAKRYAGKSKLSFNSLVVHGISALACYSEKIGVRAILTSSILLGLIALAMTVVFGVRFFTPLAVPGWATMVAGFLVTFSLQVLMLGFAFSLLILARRQDVGFIPLRDVDIYVLERRVL